MIKQEILKTLGIEGLRSVHGLYMVCLTPQQQHQRSSLELLRHNISFTKVKNILKSLLMASSWPIHLKSPHNMTWNKISHYFGGWGGMGRGYSIGDNPDRKDRQTHTHTLTHTHTRAPACTLHMFPKLYLLQLKLNRYMQAHMTKWNVLYRNTLII